MRSRIELKSSYLEELQMKVDGKNLAKNALIAVSCFSLGFAGALEINPALAQNPVSFSGCGADPELKEALKNHFIKKFFSLIDASEPQQKELNALFDSQFEYAKPLRAKMRAQGIEIADMVADESVSNEALSKKIDSVKAIQEQIANRRRATMMKVRSTLTKEQKEIIAHKMKARLTGNPRLGLFLNDSGR